MPDASASWRDMDRAALDAAYNNNAGVANSAEIVAEWQARSSVFRGEGEVELDIAYGERPREKFDYFRAKPEGGLLFVFIHGGYWQMREKETFALFAQGPRARGFNVALPGYTLAPEVRLSAIVEEMRSALTFLAGNAETLGFDPGAIYVGGWSAGGHLTATLLDHPVVKGGLAISGIFDLEPIAHSYLDEALALDDAEIEALSPIRRLRPGLAPVRLCVGGEELPELRRQSRNYAEAARETGLSVPLKELAGHNHFTILEELASPDGILTEELVALASAVQGGKR
jgi:arylformamidase